MYFFPLSLGISSGFSSVAIPQLRLPEEFGFNKEQASWFGALLSLTSPILHTPETVYKVPICPRVNLLYIHIYLITDQFFSARVYWGFVIANL